MDEINKVVAQANKLYALNSFEEAADLYAQASELLATLNGEDSPSNADVMFLYGRTLLKVAMQKSQVLGSSGQDNSPAIDNAKHSPSADLVDSRFSFQGDEEPEGEDEEQEHGHHGEAEDGSDAQPNSADDDFQDAWEILDLARLSFQKQLENATELTDKSEIKKRIADTYDLLGEVALENENFDQAVSDLKAALELKKELYPESSSQRSGAHYMLALALEYCTSPSSREAAATEVQSAIESFQIRLRTMSSEDKNFKNEHEMLGELNLKLAELQAPPELIKKEDVSEIFGKEGAALKDSVVQAMQTSNDLSNLVRKKEKRTAPASGPSTGGKTLSPPAKKVKVEDVKLDKE